MQHVLKIPLYAIREALYQRPLQGLCLILKKETLFPEIACTVYLWTQSIFQRLFS